MKLYTKAELKEELLQGKSFDQLMPSKNGQECEIFKSDDFYPGEAIVYVPDFDLNNIDWYKTNLTEEEIGLHLEFCYTGDDFIELCDGDLKMAERTFWFCDWQHPSTGYEDLCICDENCDDCGESNESVCSGCAYYNACGDSERTEPCDGWR